MVHARSLKCMQFLTALRMSLGDNVLSMRCQVPSIRAAQNYKDDCEQKHPSSVECAGFFVKMLTEEVNKPVNTTLGAITQSWDQWAENNVPHNISRRVAQGIEQLVVESFSALQEVAILGV